MTLGITLYLNRKFFRSGCALNISCMKLRNFFPIFLAVFLLLRQQADSGLAAISAATGGSSFYSGDSGSGSAISSPLLSSCAVKQALKFYSYFKILLRVNHSYP